MFEFISCVTANECSSLYKEGSDNILGVIIRARTCSIARCIKSDIMSENSAPIDFFTPLINTAKNLNPRSVNKGTMLFITMPELFVLALNPEYNFTIKEAGTNKNIYIKARKAEKDRLPRVYFLGRKKLRSINMFELANMPSSVQNSFMSRVLPFEKNALELFFSAQFQSFEDAKAKAIEDAKAKAIEDAKAKAIEDAKAKAIEDAKAKAIEDAKAKAIEDANAKAIEDAKAKAIEDAKHYKTATDRIKKLTEKAVALCAAYEKAGVTIYANN